MREISSVILKEYEIRKSRKDKARFESLLRRYGVDFTVDEGGFFKSRNLIVGNPESAKVLISAHYDTCARLPLPMYMFPMNIVFSLIGGMIPVFPILIAMLFHPRLYFYLMETGRISATVGAALMPITSLALLFLLFFLIAGPIANPHTANDNTSGVIMLLELMERLDEETKKKVAFIFFDNEEYGLFGSSIYRKHYPEAIKRQLLINFDCVSEGNHMLVVYNKGAKGYLDALQFPAEEKKPVIKSSLLAFFPSDQMGFPRAVAVAFLKKGPMGLFLSRIHTAKDTVFQQSNIEYLCDAWSAIIRRIVSD